MNMRIELKAKSKLHSKKMIFCFILVVMFYLFVERYAFSQEESDLTTKKVCINNICIEAEVVISRESVGKGLMFRNSLPEKQGMLFIFGKEDRHSFWMKNMIFPLDMIWIDSHKKIVAISQDVEPCSDSCVDIVPLAKSKYVLEVNSGFTKKNNINIGDQVEF